ncbi:hypothetical protein EDE05_112101 [Neorhizobium sp. R1-B]|nr:hypothetical protein EDE05_112101 [Neorhizobium sp. R1-B]
MTVYGAFFLTASALHARTGNFVGAMSSLTGGAFSQRMIASKAGRSCFFSSAVMSASIPQASPIAIQSMAVQDRWPFAVNDQADQIGADIL